MTMITQMFKKITPILVLWSMVYSLWSAPLLAEENKEDELFFIAQQALTDGFYDIAKDYFRRYINEYPQSSRRIDAELLIGQCYYNDGEYVKALSIFESLLKQRNTERIDDALLFWIGQVYFKGKDFQRAKNYYDRLVTNFPGSDYAAYGNFYKAELFSIQGDHSQAIELWQNFIKDFPDHELKMEADFKIGEAMYHLKEYNSCLLHFSAFLKFYPDSYKLIEAALYRAESEFYLEKYSSAIVNYLSVIKNTKPSVQLHWQARLGISWAYLQQKRYREAEVSFLAIRKDLVRKEIFVQAQFGMALLLKERDKKNFALDVYNEIIRSHPEPAHLIEAYIAKADLLYDMDRINEAILTYKEALTKFAGDSYFDEVIDKIRYGLAWAYLREGDFKKSIAEFQQVAKFSEDNVVKVSALCQIADTYLDNDKFGEAIEIYDSVLRDYPDSFYADYAQYQLANCFYKKEDFDQALLAFRSVLKNFPDSRLKGEVSYAIGLVYFSKGDFLASLRQYDSFIKDFSDHNLVKEALYLKGICLYNLSRFKEAIGIFSQVQKRFSQDKELVINSEYQIADCYFRLDNEKEALNRFRSFLTRHPDSKLSLQIMLWLGEYFLENNDPGNARRYIRQIINKSGGSELIANAYYLFAQSFLLEEDLNKALDWFDKASSVAKGKLVFKILLDKAGVLKEIGRTQEAVIVYQEVASGSSDFAKSAWIHIADIYRNDSDYDNALSLLRKSLDLTPYELNPSVQFKIAETLEQMRNFPSAISEYLKVSYLYSDVEDLVIKSLLRAAELSERQEKWQDSVSFYEKIITLETTEAKHAQERIDWIEKNILLTQE